MAPGPLSNSDVRVGFAFWITLLGMVIAGGLAVYLVQAKWPVADVVALVGVFTSLIGTLVGAFLGVQVGAAGKAEAEASRQHAEQATSKAEADKTRAEQDKAKAEELTRRVLGMLPPDQAEMALRPSSN